VTAKHARPSGVLVGAVLLALIVGVGGGWAAQSLLTPPAALPTAPTYVLAKATRDTVQRQIGLDAKAAWTGATDVSGGLPGTVTSIRLGRPTKVTAGQVAFAVDLKPVVVAEGAVPSFRDLKVGVSGEDVRQLQRLIGSATGASVGVDGTFGTGLANAVKRWQKDLGVQQTGDVAKGSVLFVPSLPSVMTTAADVRVGGGAPVGTPALRVLPATPSFSVVLPTNQASLTKTGMVVRLAYGSARWVGRIAELDAPGDDGSVVATIGPAQGATSVCSSTCAAVPPGGATVSAEIEVVPATTGVTVPTQVLIVGPQGGASVVDAGGRSVPVTVKATAGGIAVVDGLDEGSEVRVPTNG
jgi:peptidoglycan hydrolase-like protein with peptidoglycan-binding domain